MKFLILLPLFVVGCVTAIPLTSQETCSVEGMVPSGLVIGNESGGGVVSQYGSNNIYVSSQSVSRNVMCRPIANESEKCGLFASRKAQSVKSEFNNSVGGKRMLTGVGYVIFWPGLIANYIFESQKSDTMTRASQTFESESMMCEKSEVRVPATKQVPH